MVTEEGVGMIHLTLVQDAKEKGRISVHLNTQELGTVSVEAKVGSDSAELYGISDTSADKLSEKLEQAAEELKENKRIQRGGSPLSGYPYRTPCNV